MDSSRLWRCCLAALLAAAVSAVAMAELENVTVGGQIRIRGNYWRNTFNSGVTPDLVGRNIRWTANAMVGRPIGSFLGGQTLISHFDWDSFGSDYKNVEQHTRLRVRADFTHDVAAFIELDSFDVWGEDFRSNYVTGVDARAASADDLEVYQAYVQAENLWGVPLRLRAGRQELVFGSGWLVGDNSALPESTGLSFDGIRLTYSADPVTVDAFWAKLAERGPIEEDGDTDFAGVYATCRAVQDWSFDLYWLWLRDAAARKDTLSAPFNEWLEDLIGLDDYAVTNLHTAGIRAAGAWGGFDLEAEAAYQFGDASAIGALFRPYVYGDDEADFSEWAGHAELGYTFDVQWRPRVWLGAAYFGGEDNRDITFWQWVNPFATYVRPEASVSFNRLFSNTVYSYFIDEMAELTDFWTVRGGVSAHPAGSIEAGIDWAYFQALETFDQPVHVRLGRTRVPILPVLSFWTHASSADLGWQLGLWCKYHYSDDVTFEAGWAHLFTGDGLDDGNFNDLNGLLFNGGTGDNDADYLYFETTVEF